MATSDNVIRAGLTPKLKDIDTLISMLNYSYGPANERVTEGIPILQNEKYNTLINNLHSQQSKVFVYDPPVPEFAVIFYHVIQNEKIVTNEISGPSILIVIEGKGQMNSLTIGKGHIYFIPAYQILTFINNEDAHLKIYRCFNDGSKENVEINLI